MDFHEAFEKISKNDLENIEKKKYYLNAVISVLLPEQTYVREFNFTFFNSKKNEIIQVIVNDNDVIIKESAKASHPTLELLDPIKITLPAEELIKKALVEFKKIKEPLLQVIFALESNECKITFITKALNVFIVHLDYNTGKVKDTSKESLMQKMQKEEAA